MSDTTDDMEMAWASYDQGRESWEEMMEGDYWQTRDGNYIDIKDMETSHIKNCIRILEKSLANKPGEQIYMGDSEYAEDAVESENRINDYKAELIKNKLDQFEEELQKRQKKLLAGKGSF